MAKQKSTIIYNMYIIYNSKYFYTDLFFLSHNWLLKKLYSVFCIHCVILKCIADIIRMEITGHE